MNSSKSKQKLGEKVFTSLRDRIVNLEYQPETVLSEKELCREFGVSRSPVREAILRLEQMNLVRSIPRYGTYVNHIDINEIRSAYEVKVHLDYLAGSLAADRITTDQLEELQAIVNTAEKKGKKKEVITDLDVQFHEKIYQASGNPVLEQILVSLHSRCVRLCKATISELMGSQNTIVGFREIYEALKQRNKERAGELCANHARYFFQSIKKKVL